MTDDQAVARVRNIIESETTAYFSNDELKEFIKMGVDEFIQQYYMAFETSQDVRDKLQKLVRSELIAGSTSPQLNITTPEDSQTDADVKLDFDYSRILAIHYQEAPYTNVKIVQLGDITAYLGNDPFNKADENNPVAYEQGGFMYFLGLIGTTNLIVKYLRYTTDIELLSIHTHEEVCQISARKVLATLGDARYQMIQSELTERRV
jgi:hypothetical protein|tara:strand:- start:52 stop:669 length:618 start_codon:yes stop_codon:yes gene_type:complete